jgi:predicted phosphodiesterase
MGDSETSKGKLYALLIGVDCYLPNRLPDGGFYPSLGGCVRDINHVENFLRERLELTDAEILKLTATNNGTSAPPEPQAQWPTYENMVAAFQQLMSRAQPGDQVYVHYSGHGGRTVTSFPKLKGEKGLDETLVPTDIGAPGTRYLRDVEMAYLLKQMSDKGLVVTIILDSCHSGGATRGLGGGAVRGISSIDTSTRPGDSLVATSEALEAFWQGIPQEQTRSAQLSSGWFPAMKDTVLIAACRANELANEFAFEGRERNGALTYWLLDSLKQVGPGLTYSMLHDRLLAKVHAKFQQQTPQLLGNGERTVFGIDRVNRPPASRVIEVDAANRQIKIEAGQVQGIGVGARFAIFPATAKDFTDEANQLAVAEVQNVQSTSCRATILQPSPMDGINESAQAVLLDAGTLRFRRTIGIVHRDDLLPEINQQDALERFTEAIKENKWVRLAEKDEGVDYQIAVNANGEYEIWEPSGQIINNLRPALKIKDPQAAVELTKRLVHLTKYNNVKMLENSASTSPLARQISLEVVNEAAKSPGGTVILDDGEQLTLRIKNNTASQALNITVLDLQPDWGITKLFPPDADSMLLDPKGEPIEMTLNFELPKGYKEGIDTIKVFATIDNTSFNWLELPALDKPIVTKAAGAKRAGLNALEQLMADFAAEKPPENQKRASLASVSVAQWTTVQLDVNIRRRPPSLKHTRDVSMSLLQAAFEEVGAEQQSANRAEANGPGGRPSLSDPIFNAITDYLANPQEEPSPSESAERSAWDSVKYCAGLAAGVAREFWNAHVMGDSAKYDEYKQALTVKFGGCDPKFGDAVTRYVEFLLKHGTVPYRPYKDLSDSVIEGQLPDDALIGIVADWGTGQPEAIEVLRQVKALSPQVVMHLGDVYYAGTAKEVEDYFYKPWQDVLQPEASGITSLTVPGNHDYYSGGAPFYDLLDKFKQAASYFCLRNQHWQLIGLDTGLNDRLGGPPTTLHPTELDWLRDKIQNADGRRTVLLSHHQLFSTNEQFEGKSYNPNLYAQLEDLLPKVDLWLWGHEHDLVIFGDYMNLQRGRCIGGSAFPVGKYEVPDVVKNPDVPFNKQVLLSKGSTFYQHCYTVMKLDGAQATVDYYEDSEGGKLLFREKL